MQDWILDIVVPGQPVSSKNRRRIVGMKSRRPRLIKSADALSYVEMVKASCPVLNPLLDGDLYIHVDAYYASRRPDLACLEIIRDALEGRVYENDRQIKMESATWNLDKDDPRARIRIRWIGSRQCTDTYSSMLCGTLDLATPAEKERSPHGRDVTRSKRAAK